MHSKPLTYNVGNLCHVVTKRLARPSPLVYPSERTPGAGYSTGPLVRTEVHKSSSPGPSPDSQTPPEQPLPQSGPGSISDHEWNLRAGRAVYTLRTTLPSFFETGLVSRVDRPPSSSSRPGSSEIHSTPSESKSTHNSESIYAPNIRLSYTPPSTLSLPSPFPKTLQVEGLPLYHASATFIRHTLIAFNTDLHVEMRKFYVRSPGSRNRQIVIRTGVTGKSRISGASNEWDVHSTYTLSPHTALIDLHIVESIHPAPHITFYDGLRAALARLAGADVGREAGAGIRGCVSDHRLRPIPIQEEIKTTEKE